MKDLLGIVQNIKKGPKTSLVGFILFIAGGYAIYTHEDTMTYTSIEVGIFVLGLYLFLSSDGPIANALFKKKKKDEDSEE
jgi:hypothetical protein